MKKFISILLSAALIAVTLTACNGETEKPANENTTTTTAANNTPTEPTSNEDDELPTTNNPPTSQTMQLDIGTMLVYDYGDMKLHAYDTKDYISNVNFILETATELILIELVPFNDNIDELKAYIDGLGKPLVSVIVAYHPAGADCYPEASFYASENLGEAWLVPIFAEEFGDIFNDSLPEDFENVKSGTITISGVDFNISMTDSAFDFSIPAINVFLTHMLGEKTHNILGSVEEIDTMVSVMQHIQAEEYGLVLTSHDIPRGNGIAAEKIAYLTRVKELATANDNANDFITAMNAEFPDYGGEDYLGMTAEALFGEE